MVQQTASKWQQAGRRVQPRSTVTLQEQDKDILRGTSASVLLAWFGRRLRSTTGGIGLQADKEAEDEYSNSFQVLELDIFLSHSWHAPWYLKYFTLLFYFNARPAIVVTLFAAVLCCAVRFIEADVFYSMSDFLDSQLTTCPCLAFGSLSFFFTIFFWQHFLVLRERVSAARGQVVKSLFLDKVCIHQTDADKKAKGIKSIGAILAQSKMVLVAWDQSYFSRLWCTFELAAYKYARPESAVVVLPVNIGGFIATLIFTNFGAQVTVAILKVIPQMKPVTKNHLAIYMTVYFVVACTCTGFFRAYVKALKEMDGQLQSFSVEDAECFCCKVNHVLPETGAKLPCDRKLVNASIVHWSEKFDTEGHNGLQKFDNLIRGTFRQDIAQSFRGSRVPYHFVLLYSIWAGLYQLDHLVPQRYKKDGEDPKAFMRSLEVFHTVFLCYPMNIALFIRLCVLVFSKFEEYLRIESWWLRRLIDFIMACIACGQSYATIMFSNYLLRVRDEMALGIAWVVAEAIFVYLLYRRVGPAAKSMSEELGINLDNLTRMTRFSTIFPRMTTRMSTAVDAPMLSEEDECQIAGIELAERIKEPPPFFDEPLPHASPQKNAEETT